MAVFVVGIVFALSGVSAGLAVRIQQLGVRDGHVCAYLFLYPAGKSVNWWLGG